MEEREFLAWLAETQRDVRAALGRFRGSILSISDLEQEIAVIAWAKKEDFSDFNHFRNWIVKKAGWLAIDEFRKSQRTHQFFSRLEEGIDGKFGLTPEQNVMLREIEEAIKELPPNQMAVVKGMFEGKTSAQLAQELKITEATVRSLRRFGKAELIRLRTTKKG